ncbi:hypothetical protein EDD11_007973 [Mortierella claussenii]|nr:hypothetical protein EDD11_007973 [Mortierella claussenii]
MAPSAAAGKGGTNKSTTPTAILDSVLAFNCANITMNCGTALRTSESLQPNLTLDDDQTRQLCKSVAGVIQEMVRVAAEATRCKVMAFSLTTPKSPSFPVPNKMKCKLTDAKRIAAVWY